MYDVELAEGNCPACQEPELRHRRCHELDCEDGYCESDDNGPRQKCDECNGTGQVRWCAKCGHEITPAEWSAICAQNDY